MAYEVWMKGLQKAAKSAEGSSRPQSAEDKKQADRELADCVSEYMDVLEEQVWRVCVCVPFALFCGWFGGCVFLGVKVMRRERAGGWRERAGGVSVCRWKVARNACFSQVGGM